MMNLNYLISLTIKFNKTWYNIYEAYNILNIRLRNGLNFRLLFNITLILCIMQENTNALPNIDDKIRLLSISAASKILGIRHKAVTDLIKGGKIKIIDLNGRIKIPRKNLEMFIDLESKTIPSVINISTNNKLPQSMKNILNSIINKHK